MESWTNAWPPAEARLIDLKLLDEPPDMSKLYTEAYQPK